jgi:hypothetical protein
MQSCFGARDLCRKVCTQSAKDLPSWSLVSLEASLFGSPMILPNNPISVYRGVADKVCRQVDEYWEAVMDGLDTAWSLERSIKTFRWYWLIQFGGAVDLQGGRPEKKSLKAFAVGTWHLLYGMRNRLRLPLPPLPEQWRLPDSEFLPLLQRRQGYRGAAVIQATLAGDLDPMDSFDALLKMQGMRGSQQPAPAGEAGEQRAVYDEVERLFRVLGGGSLEKSGALRIRDMLGTGKP